LVSSEPSKLGDPAGRVTLNVEQGTPRLRVCDVSKRGLGGGSPRLSSLYGGTPGPLNLKKERLGRARIIKGNPDCTE
jgi:hypothetical protein